MAAPSLYQFRGASFKPEHMCIHASLHSPASTFFGGYIVVGDATINDVFLHRQQWWVLPETVALERRMDISLGRNVYQNENQAAHGIEILKNINDATETLPHKLKHINQGTLWPVCPRGSLPI